MSLHSVLFTSSWQTPQPSVYPSPITEPSPSTSALVATTSATAKSETAKARAPAWSFLEEETRILIYKAEAESNKGQKGKRPATVWATIAEKLEGQAKELGFASHGRSAQKVKEKFFNLLRRYKQAKDKVKTSGEGSDEIFICPHFELLDEFMGSRDCVNPRFVAESGARDSQILPHPLLMAAIQKLQEMKLRHCRRSAEKIKVREKSASVVAPVQMMTKTNCWPSLKKSDAGGKNARKL